MTVASSDHDDGKDGPVVPPLFPWKRMLLGLTISVVLWTSIMGFMMFGPKITLPWSNDGKQKELPIGKELRVEAIPLPGEIQRVREFAPNPDNPEWAFVPGRFQFRDHWNNEVIGGLKARFVWQLGRVNDLELVDGVYRTTPYLGGRARGGWTAREVSSGVYEIPKEAWGKVLCLELQAEGGFIPTTAAFRMHADGRLSLLWGSLLAGDAALPPDAQAGVLKLGDPATRPQVVDSAQLWHPTGCLPAISVLQAGKLSAQFVDHDGEPLVDYDVTVGWAVGDKEIGVSFVQPRQVLVTDQQGRCEIDGIVGSIWSYTEDGSWRNPLRVVRQSRTNLDATREQTELYWPLEVLPGTHVQEALYVRRDLSVEPTKGESNHVSLGGHVPENQLDAPLGEKGVSARRLGTFFLFASDPGSPPKISGRDEMVSSRFTFADEEDFPGVGLRLSLRWSQETEAGRSYGGLIGYAETGSDGSCYVWSPSGRVSAYTLSGNWHAVGADQMAGAAMEPEFAPWLCHACGHIALTIPESAPHGMWSVRPTNTVEHGLQPSGPILFHKSEISGRRAFVTGLKPHDYFVGVRLPEKGLGMPSEVKVVAGRTTVVGTVEPDGADVRVSGGAWDYLNGSVVSPRSVGGQSSIYFAADDAARVWGGPTGKAHLAPDSFFPIEWQYYGSEWRVATDGGVSVPKSWVAWGMWVISAGGRLYTHPELPMDLATVDRESVPFAATIGDLWPLTIRLDPEAAEGEVVSYALLRQQYKPHGRLLIPVDGREHKIWIPVHESAAKVGTDPPGLEARGELECRLEWTYVLSPKSEIEKAHWDLDDSGNAFFHWVERSARVMVSSGREPQFLWLAMPAVPRAVFEETRFNQEGQYKHTLWNWRSGIQDGNRHEPYVRLVTTPGPMLEPIRFKFE